MVYGGGISTENGETAATGTVDGLILFIDVKTRAYKTLLSGRLSPVKSLAYSPDGTRLAGGTADGAAVIWKMTNP